MKYHQLLRYASIGICYRLDKAQYVEETLKAEGKESPISSARIKKLEMDFDTVQNMLDNEVKEE